MAPAVILIGCLLATMSCSTTASHTSTTPTAPAPTTTTATMPSSTPPDSPTSTTTPAPAMTTTTETMPSSTPPDSPISTTPASAPTTIPEPSTSTTTTAAIPVNPPPFGSCGNPDMCCAGRNDACFRGSCYCDVACLRLHDCCPDFGATCLTANNRTTLPITGSCSEPTLCCSGFTYDCFRGCFCDEVCRQLNDCCPDINNACPTAPPVTVPPAPPFNSTADPTFDPTLDPTVDSTSDPPFISTVDPTFDSTAAPPQVTTVSSNTSSATTIPVTTRPGVTNATTPTSQTPLIGSCGNPDLCCSGLNSSCLRLNCYCDVACLRFGDCCPDFKHTCLTVNNSSNSTKPNNTLPLTGSCSEPTLCCSGVNYTCFRGCFCDEVCRQFNDCCPDINTTCIFSPTTTPAPFTSTANPPVISTAAPILDVLTLLTNLEVELLAEESSTEEERQAALRQVGALVENYLREYNDIYSFEVTRIEPVSPCD